MQYGRFPKAADLPSPGAARSFALRPDPRPVQEFDRETRASPRPTAADPMKRVRPRGGLRHFDSFSSKWVIRLFQWAEIRAGCNKLHRSYLVKVGFQRLSDTCQMMS